MQNLLVNHKKPQIIAIGPEGDFTNQEINDSLKHGFRMVELGKNRLRTETACLVSVTLMKFWHSKSLNSNYTKLYQYNLKKLENLLK